MKARSSAYAAAGVNIDHKMAALRAIKRMVQRTAAPGPLSEIGAFGGMFSAPGRDQVLVASSDGVGTKLKVAQLVGRHDTIGQDIVNHCVNDILVQGARPLFFLDYFGTAGLQPKVFREVVAGLCRGCRANNCALIGGETAEMPGLYPPGEYDLVGAIVGVVGRRQIITGQTIRPGDILIGLPSSGLHTNGYSLARKIIFEQARLSPQAILPGTRRRVADVLLAVHRSYLKPIQGLRQQLTIRGLAHITGGGFADNISRVLPQAVDAIIDRAAWRVPPVFRFLEERGRVPRAEMFRVFNMGIGLVVIIRAADKKAALHSLRSARALEIGRVEKGSGQVRLIN
ncbi:MAG: phosphoribosylformylglycinamidine cyclo-ligase [Lentisphaerae bacterium]|nr:phosphoribosylformylglycinamidine cyclo-ligase [Lentisphaerota bacterium]